MSEEQNKTEAGMTEVERRSNVKHVQTLVEMNHCVGVARRDAAFQCVKEYTDEAEKIINGLEVTERLKKYEYCRTLVEEAMVSTKRSSVQFDRSGVMDRPVTHVLKLLLELVNAMTSLASHVMMVEREATVLSELLGEETYDVLVNTCDNFDENETQARQSFIRMLKVADALLGSSTTRHRERFTHDDERRYQLAYNEFYSHYKAASAEKNDGTAVSDAH